MKTWESFISKPNNHVIKEHARERLLEMCAEQMERFNDQPAHRRGEERVQAQCVICSCIIPNVQHP